MSDKPIESIQIHGKTIEQMYLINYAALERYLEKDKNEPHYQDMIEKVKYIELKINKLLENKFKCQKRFCNNSATHLTLKPAIIDRDYEDPHFWCKKHIVDEKNASYSISGPISFKYATHFRFEITQKRFCKKLCRALGIKSITKNNVDLLFDV